MAASAATASSSPGLCPNYAVICSFLERYGALLDLPELTFPQLERYLRDTSSVPKLLVDLHVKLLRKIGKSVSADRWEKYLLKVCQELNTTWAWELEQKGYKELSTECKTGLLKYLCECQFDDNVKFKTAINEEDPDKMRLQPIGRDKDGQMYWFQLDQSDNVRLYIEEQDDLDGSSWKCIVKDRSDLAEVVALLKTQIDPALLKRDEENKAAAEEGKEKTDGEVKKIEDSSDEDIKDNKAAGPVSPKTENDEKATEKDDFKSETSLNGLIEGKPEAKLTSEKPPTDLSIITKVQNIKEEPMEVSDTKSSCTETREPASEATCLSVKAEKGEEAKKTEEIQIALKNDQQAKIPLKKRGMKFTEDFEKSSGIIVQNPSVSQLKEAPKADSTPDPTKGQSVNDHVNGDVASEKNQMCESLKDAVVDKEQNVEPAAAKPAEKRENDSLPADHKGGDSSAEMSEVASKQADSGQKTPDPQVETESTASKEKAGAASLPKDVNNASEKPSNHKEQERLKDSSTSKDLCDVDKTLKETDKTKRTGESEKDASRSKESEEKAASVDTSKSSKAEETKTKQTERRGDKEKETCDANVEKSDKSEEKEKPGVIKSSEKDPAKKPAESEKAATSVGKNTDKLKERDHAEATTSPKKAEMRDKSDTRDNVESPVIKKLDKPCKPDEKQDKDGEKKPQKASETDAEKPKKPEDVKKTVNCEDGTMHDVSKISGSTPEPTEEEAVAVKPDVTKPQVDDKTEINSVACKEKKGETSEGKDKLSSVAEKIMSLKKPIKNLRGQTRIRERCLKRRLRKWRLSVRRQEDTDLEKKKDTDLEKKRDTDLEKKKDTDLEKKKDTDLEKKKDTDLEKKRDTDLEKKKDTDLEKKKDTDLEKKKDTDLEKKKDTDLEKKKDTDLEKKRDTDSGKKKDKELETDKENNTITERKKDTNKEKKEEKEKPQKDSEKQLCQDKEEDSKTDETKEEKQANKENETSTVTEESVPEDDGKSSTEKEKAGDPSKEPDTEKPADEEDDEDSAPKKEVANGRGTPASRRRLKRPVHRRKAGAPERG
ncbi:hypothetical protein PBY51_002396 [Eleginops maclovinus]|uniref:DDT domain-containing protein n=1 Tax=Eleginops maclovinus TaxID=56733 RepID=A0AAN7X8A5_ELEMC|nr:hypothetical protein PBY51_002396 [Eleginops maclovinus]